MTFHFNKEDYVQYLVKNQVDRIQCNDTGKHTYETLAYLYKGKPTPLKYSDVLHRAGCSESGLKFWLKQLSNFGVIEMKELSFSTFNLKKL
ncbi:hypothetical protein GDQ70_16445 [Escherichia coli]|nr:hypothetical protein [Escherichia coli]EFN8622760.1 hypothetical protein [Escherichia coli O51]EFE7004205.1 hypothetical protein [Escherichia coli]EFN9866849.1 hypothetical protein [Escherichia coli]VEE28843.1 Uncharacterised protein [Escherichia coli]